MDDNALSISDYFRRKNQEKLQADVSKIEKKIEKRNRAHTSTFILMLSVAIIFDIVQGGLVAIPFVGWILSSLISIFAWLTFYVWTSIKGWGLSDTVKQAIVTWAIPFVEIIPILNVLPAWTLKVVLSYSFLKAEDALYNATDGKADIEKLMEIYKKVA